MRPFAERLCDPLPASPSAAMLVWDRRWLGGILALALLSFLALSGYTNSNPARSRHITSSGAGEDPLLAQLAALRDELHGLGKIVQVSRAQSDEADKTLHARLSAAEVKQSAVTATAAAAAREAGKAELTAAVVQMTAKLAHVLETAEAAAAAPRGGPPAPLAPPKMPPPPPPPPP